MNVLNLFAGQTRPESRRRRANVSLGAESLEGRQLLSTATLGHSIVHQPAAMVSSPTVVHNTAPNPAMTNQQGAAFGLRWRAYHDSYTGKDNIDIQDAAGNGSIGMYRTKAGLFFTTNVYNTTSNSWSTLTVAGPTLPQNDYISIRNFANKGDLSVTMGTGLQWTYTTLPRTQVSYVNTPTGSIKLTYDYNSYNNTATLTVDNIKGSGMIFYSKQQVNPDPGEHVDSPTANPIQSITFSMQSSDGYGGGAQVFVPGEADPTINVVVNNNGNAHAGYYTIKQGAW